MLKTSSKRRRTMAEIRADKEAKLKKELDAAQKDIEIQTLQQQVMQLQEDVKTGALAANLMSQLVDNGLVK